ncbi:hypothetical protein F2Q68_00014370 [Brassica cretica]|uniref:Uncharacterized protein n=2 Tax=Brassica cretica TaxID=69181 RepID=A0ABQ7EY55_BRACR|nr:hypothetical protein F2Q68_00014370 [Brassica cretica]KAF3608205.1 hypothetical protein DY000_02046847 [Brassica cretica]
MMRAQLSDQCFFTERCNPNLTERHQALMPHEVHPCSFLHQRKSSEALQRSRTVKLSPWNPSRRPPPPTTTTCAGHPTPPSPICFFIYRLSLLFIRSENKPSSSSRSGSVTTSKAKVQTRRSESESLVLVVVIEYDPEGPSLTPHFLVVVMELLSIESEPRPTRNTTGSAYMAFNGMGMYHRRDKGVTASAGKKGDPRQRRCPTETCAVTVEGSLEIYKGKNQIWRHTPALKADLFLHAAP